VKTTPRHLLHVLSLVLSLVATACASGETGFAIESNDGAADDASSLIVVTDDATVSSTGDDDYDGGLPFVIVEDASPPGTDAAVADGAAPSLPFDAGDAGACGQQLVTGDLIIVELMIESTPGTGDHGEWLEVTSTLGCAVNLNGLSGECPTGAKVNSFTVGDDLWIPPGGTFVIADSSNPAVNHDLPAPVITWAGQPGDVLRNEGATVTLLMNDVIIDSVTYPNRKLTPGVSIAFPADCPPGLRPSWAAWLDSARSWFPEFQGTPNAPNTDVECPIEADD
jgi:hypothetical protein